MKKINFFGFIFSAISDAINSFSYNYKKNTEYICEREKLEIIYNQLDFEVYKSKLMVKYEINNSSRRKTRINSILDEYDESRESDRNNLENLVSKKTKLYKLITANSDCSKIEKYHKMITSINNNINSYIDESISRFENMVEDIISCDQADSDNKKLLLELKGN